MRKWLIITALAFFAACNPEPAAKYEYNYNPVYTQGFAYNYGAYYAAYGNPNSVVVLQLLTDSLLVNERYELEGYGNYLYINNIFLPPNSKMIPDGTYTASDTEEAFTFAKGEIFTADSIEYSIGSRVYFIERNRKLSKQHLIDGGQFTVTGSGKVQTVIFDLILDNSVHLKGTYNGEVEYEMK